MFVALPTSKSRIEACGGVRACALLAILAVTRGLELDDVDCPKCGIPHIDYSMMSHVKHFCGSCGSYFQGSRHGVCNPLLSFLEIEKNEIRNNSFACLNDFSVEEILACASKLGEEISNDDIADYLNKHAPNTESTIVQ